jgi:hypothetical protein
MPAFLYELVRFTPQELAQRLKTMTWAQRETERLQLYAEFLKSQSQAEPAPDPFAPHSNSTIGEP